VDIDAAGFEAAAGAPFLVTHGGGQTELRLASVERFPSGGPRAEGFSLIFVGENDVHLEQGTYAFSHPEAGAMDIFIVPIQPGADAKPRYEAIFN